MITDWIRSEDITRKLAKTLNRQGFWVYTLTGRVCLGKDLEPMRDHWTARLDGGESARAFITHVQGPPDAPLKEAQGAGGSFADACEGANRKLQAVRLSRNKELPSTPGKGET